MQKAEEQAAASHDFKLKLLHILENPPRDELREQLLERLNKIVALMEQSQARERRREELAAKHGQLELAEKHGSAE